MKHRQKHTWAVIVALGMVTVLMFVAAAPAWTAAAQDPGDRDWKPEQGEHLVDEMDRHQSILSEDDYTEVESVCEGADVENALYLRMETSNSPALELAFSSEVETNGTETERELQLTLVFEEIMEYADENGDGMWSNGEEVVQVLSLDDYTFSSPAVTRVTAGGVQGYRLETASTGNFVFRLVAYSYQERAIHDGVDLMPTDMKFDIIIQSFPYQEEGTQIALKIGIESEIDISMVNGHEIEVEDANASAYFTWSGECTADGVTSLVNSRQVLTDEDGQPYVYLFYPRASNIVHDPILGVNINTVGIGGGVVPPVVLFLLGAALAAVVVASSVYWRRKKNGRY